MKMKIIEDLDVYKKSKKFVVKIYMITRSYPACELYGLTSQMRRAAVSIISNLSEGGSRLSDGELKVFLGYARGSAAELKAQIIISKEIGLIGDEYDILISDITEIHKMITGLIKSKE